MPALLYQHSCSVKTLSLCLAVACSSLMSPTSCSLDCTVILGPIVLPYTLSFSTGMAPGSSWLHKPSDSLGRVPAANDSLAWAYFNSLWISQTCLLSPGGYAAALE